MYFRFLLMISSALLTDFEHLWQCSRFLDLPIYLYHLLAPILNMQLLLGTLTCMSKNLNLYNILHVWSVLQDGITMWHVYLNIPLLSERNRKLLKMCHLYKIVYGFLKPYYIVEMGVCSSRCMFISRLLMWCSKTVERTGRREIGQ